MVSSGSLTPPREKESTYLMADFVELLCVCSPDKEIYRNDAIGRVYGSAETEALMEVESEERDKVIHAAPLNDRVVRNAEDWFRHLAYRAGAFGDHYPFQVEADHLALKPCMSPGQRTYLLLLLCSSLRVVSNRASSDLTSGFELLCTQAMRSYLPKFEVRHFGKAAGESRPYPSKLLGAIEMLATDLREHLSSRLDIRSCKNTGDGGLDIVAWRRPFGDDMAPGSLICFAQCACSPSQWVNKQDEAARSNWSKRIDFVHSPANFMFVPFCFRKADGHWFESDKIRHAILIDRLRICSLLSGADTSEFDAAGAVDDLLAHSEPA